MDVEFPPLSSKEGTELACRRWRVAQCPLKEAYWERTLQEEGFPPKFKTWLLRTITEGVDLGYRGEERNHVTRKRSRTIEERNLLAAQYKKELSLHRVVCTGQHRPWGPLFKKFFVSSTYTIPKKRLIGQPQKWRLCVGLVVHLRVRYRSGMG